MSLPSPEKVCKALAAPSLFIEETRRIAQNIIQGTNSRIALLVGPCSIHDPIAALEYANKLAILQKQVESTFFLVMRVFLEKPRSRLGWKGFIYDPFLDNSFHMKEGILKARELLIKINHLKIPCATEFLSPLAFQYIQDLITWGVIGARTSSSPIHRELGALATFPIGFKNDLSGHLEPAIDGILTAQTAQSHLSINAKGKIKAIYSPGNPHTHLILRGAKNFTNFDPISTETARQQLQEHQIQTKIMIDCSHGNSQKNPQNQKTAFNSVISQINQNSPICGLMLESFLFEGHQHIPKTPQDLRYGISITDSCLGWKETEELILKAHQSLNCFASFGVR